MVVNDNDKNEVKEEITPHMFGGKNQKIFPLYTHVGGENPHHVSVYRGGKNGINPTNMCGGVLQFSNSLRKKIKRFENSVPKSDSKLVTGKIFVDDGVYERVSWELIKKESSRISKSKNRSMFLWINNYKGRMTPVAELGKETIVLNLIKRSKAGKDYFMDDNMDKRYVSDVGGVAVNVYEYLASVGREVCIVYSPKPIKNFGVEYYFTGVKIPLNSSKKTIRSTLNVTESVFLVSNFYMVKEDYSILDKIAGNINNIQNISLVRDFDTGGEVFSDEETWIILSNLVYMEEGNCALDLILCGKPSAKKTSWLDMLKEIFDEKQVMSVNATNRALVPSFYYDTPKLGAIMESKYVVLLDDYFRMFSQRSEKMGTFQAIRMGLESIMNLLDRKEKTIPSGKFDVNVKFKSSFFATDNFAYQHALNRIYSDDPAVLKRYTFLLMDKTSEERGTRLAEKDIQEVIECLKKYLKQYLGDRPFEKYRLLFNYLRNVITDIKYDMIRFREITDKYNGEDIYLQGKAKALMKSVIALNTLFRWDKPGLPKRANFIAKDEDYLLFDRLLCRVVCDFKTATKSIASLDLNS